MHQLLLFLLFLLLFLPDATISATTAGAGAGPCKRRCGRTVVPYPLGFSGACPILLACNASASTALLPRGAGYPVLSFNATASTFRVALAPSCSRGVAEAKAALNGAGYGVTSRTGLFLRGGCGPGNTTTSNSCNVPSAVMATILQTAQCGGGNDGNATWACVLSAPPAPNSPAAARGEGQFMRWGAVDGAGCQDVLTSAVYRYTAQGVPSIDFGMAEMGWWLDGRCGGNGTAAGGPCAQNATCHDVQTPGGAWGHRCTCLDGMSGDGFAAGEGCSYGATTGAWCGSNSVPYPFGFSGDCPILLACNATASTPLLRRKSTVAAAAYPIVSFNSTTSTFVVSFATSCSRTVGEAKASLSGDGYAVSYRTGLFLRGGSCSKAENSGCSVKSDVVLSLLRETCGSVNDSTLACVSSPVRPPDIQVQEALKGKGQFMSWDWENVSAAGCDNAVSATVYRDTAQGVPSLDFGVVELGWWLQGKCAANATSGGQCAHNATCSDVETPMSGTWGHRCTCLDGMSGDGFAAGDGCHYGARTEPSKKKIFIIAAGVVVGVLAAGGALLLCWLQCRRYKAGRSASERLAEMRLLSAAATSSGVPVYSYGEIARATNSFSHTHRLGTGAYGTVYVGKLPGTGSAPAALVAIKRLRCRHHHEDDDSAAAALLLNEIKLISSVSHPNLVRLLGCCLDRGEQVLVYEYVPNGTLSQHLLAGASGDRSRLTWRARLGVAAETAAAIAYLHGMRPPIFHRDVKSSNILLDAVLRPKLADFGLSRAVDRLEAARSHVSTAPQGTPGYVDPEYHQNFHLSDKSDVYSFGVVLLELITAMKVIDFDRPATEVNLASLALDRIGKGRVAEIVDPALLDDGEEWVMDSVRHVSELAFRCLAFQKDVRPPMREVAAELRQIRDAAPVCDLDPGSARLKPMNVMDIQIDVSLDDQDTMAKKAVSPVSVQETWVSDQSSPSTNGSMPRFTV